VIKVWHAIKPTFGFSQLAFPTDYELVAHVDTDDLDVAFELTNHISNEWWLNEDVQCVKQGRSTSVGDVLELNNKLYRCEMAGWSEIAIVPN